MLSVEQREELEAVCGPVVEWLEKNCNPHHTVIIAHKRAELFEGQCGINIFGFKEPNPLGEKGHEI